MMKEELRHIPKKNYIFLGIILLVTIFIVYYLSLWIDAYKKTRTDIFLLNNYMDVINYNEMDAYLVENPNAIIYVSVQEDNQIIEFEKKLKTSIKDNKISTDILYLDITREIKKSKSNLLKKYSLNTLSILDVPCVMVFEDGKLKAIYSVNQNGFNIDNFIKYVNGIKTENSEKK